METVEIIDVQRAIRERDFGKLHEVLGRWEHSAVAAEIRNLPVAEQAVVCRVVARQCAADVFEFLDVSAQECLLKALGKEQVAAILNDMAEDDLTALLEERTREA